MSDDAEADLSRALDRQRAQLAPHWEKVASLLSLIWKWPVPVSYASDYRYQRDRLELRRDDNGEPLFDAEEIGVRGEWFHPSEELISFVREVQDRVDFSAPHNAMYRRLLNKSIFGER